MFSVWKNLVFRVFVSGILSFVVSFSVLLIIPPPALAANDQNFFEKILEWVFTPGSKESLTPPSFDSAQDLRPTPTPSPSDGGQELTLPQKAREVVKYILELPDNIVTSRNIMGETVTTRNLSKNLLFLDEYFLDLSPIDPGGNTEGLKLPQSNDCSKGTEEGWVCWDRDDNVLTIGTGDNRSQFYGFGPSIDSSEITNGTVSFDDLANDATLDATTTWTAGTNNFIFNLDSTGDFIVQDSGTAFATFSDSGVLTLAHQGLRLTDKGSTGDPASCTAGDLYFNSTDATFKGCSAVNTWETFDNAGSGGTTILKRVSAAQTATTCATSDTNLTGGTYTLPAGQLSTNKGIRIYLVFESTTVSGTADSLQIKFDFGGTDVFVGSVSTSRGYFYIEVITHNRDSASSQIHFARSGKRNASLGSSLSFGSASENDSPINTSSIDTSSAITIAIQCTDANSGTGGDDDTITLHYLLIEELGSGS